MKTTKIPADSELGRDIEKCLKYKKKKIILAILMLVIFSVILTLLFIRIGNKYNIQFLAGQLTIMIITLVSRYFIKMVEKDICRRMTNLILQSDEINLEDFMKGVYDE